MYDISLKRKWDNHGALTYAREEGRQEGELKKSMKSAIEMKKAGLTTSHIVKFTKLTAEEIEKLK